MSHQFYSELWIVAREDVEKLLKLDQDLRGSKGAKSKDKISGQLVPMYIRYRELIRRLAICHDQICQSQKRDLIKQVLNCAIGRMLEYKKQLVLAQCFESTYADDVLIPMKLTPDDIGWQIPSYFVTDRKSLVEDRKKYINDLIEQKLTVEAPQQDLPRNSTVVPAQTESDVNLSRRTSPRLSARDTEAEIDPSLILPLRKETPEEAAARILREQLNAAVLLIQSHDRARKNRIVGTQMQRASDFKKKIAGGELEVIKHDKRTKLQAAITIQKWWRSYATRLHLKDRTNQLEAVLGMSIPSWRSHEVFDKDEQNFKRRQLLQPEYAAATLNAISAENARVHRIRGPGLMEDITDEIREWFLLWYNDLGFFDTFPLAQAGGSILIATGETRTPEEYHSEQMQRAAEAKKAKGKDNEKKEKGKTKRKGEKDQEEPKTLKCLRDANDDFLVNWSLRDESGNPKQREYVDLITDKLCYQLQLEMREIVDEIMRLELATLENALAKDNAEGGGNAEGKDQKKPKNKEKKKKNKKNKTKKSKGGKTKNKRDQVSRSTIDDLFAELVTTGIIHGYSDVKINDWKGDVSYQNVEARKELRGVKRCLGDVIQPIMEYCILPIGSKEIHQIAPLVRSVSIIGLPRSGKSLLVDAICNEVGALLFDLTPKIVAENYKTKKDLDKLINTVNKVARVYPPSLVFVDAGHQPWWKKIPPEEKLNNPKRLATPLAKLVKGIRPGDQILFLTTSDQPHKAGNKFMKLHDKIILIPLPDYNTLFLLYKKLLMQYHGVDRNLDCSTLASLSLGLSIESICDAVENVLSVNRRISLKKEPLRPSEIIEYLISNRSSTTSDIGPNEYEKILKWEKKTPVGKRRSKMEADEQLAAKQASKNAGKKQKPRKK